MRDERIDKIHLTETWLQTVIGREVALHFERSVNCDPQQLVWAICGAVVARDTALADRGGAITESLRAGIRAFFEQQDSDGIWHRGRALFHYPDAGNAYCYVFETLAELVSLSLEDVNRAGAEVRQMLRPYLAKLLLAADHLARTSRALGDSSRGEVGWSSNHHPHRTSPESWATATAFRFLQVLRRFVALEASEIAARQLKARRATKTLQTLAERGDTWDAGKGSAGALLASLFVHPNLCVTQPMSMIDHDRPALASTLARSAILFGPPGTGKTTLAESVAGSLSWGFVEITPADFLDRGSAFVSARADEIFKQLMELDRCVVLFDEIDELIRARLPSEEALSRFFTTTMLPRLAKLWELRKVIFFVNTNSIRDVDPAVRRSQRFDAAIYVLPPSRARKLEMLGSAREYVDETKLKSVFDALKQPNDLSEEDFKMAGIGFLRHDQMELLGHLAPSSPDDLRERVGRLCHELLQSDWASQKPVRENGGEVTRTQELVDLLNAFKSESEFQRVDATRLRVIADPSGFGPRDGLSTHVEGFLVWDANATLDDGVLDGAAQLQPT